MSLSRFVAFRVFEEFFIHALLYLVRNFFSFVNLGFHSYHDAISMRKYLKISSLPLCFDKSVQSLEATPKVHIDGINLRLDLLRLYDELVKKELTMKEQIAEAYAQAYVELGGSVSLAKLKNDFLIVASASGHNVDIVVSEDNSTMLNELAMKSYRIINTSLRLSLPRFIGYEEFKIRIKK